MPRKHPERARTFSCMSSRLPLPWPCGSGGW
jgi:hypothetical protein